MKLKIAVLFVPVLAALCGAARFAEAFELRVKNDFDKNMNVALVYFDTDAQKWRTRGWYIAEPHGEKKVIFKTSKTTVYIYAELAGASTTWGNGDITRTVIWQAFSYFDGQNCPQGPNRGTVKFTRYDIKNGALDFRPSTSTADAPLKSAGEAAKPAPPKPKTSAPTKPALMPATTDKARRLTDEMISLINKERERAGVKPLERHETLCRAAERRAYEIHGNFSHTRPGRREAISALNEHGIGVKAFAENLEKDNVASAAYANETLYKSKGHRENMLNAAYTHIGVGLFVQDGYYYWVQLYGDKPFAVTPSGPQNKDLDEAFDDLIKSLNELGELFK
jgi:uncharacterized protein YkwD